MDYNRIKISLDQAEKILLDLYRIEGTVSPLPGYVDFVFILKLKSTYPGKGLTEPSIPYTSKRIFSA